MKNAILLHGTGDSPNSFWLPYIKKALENRGYQVWAPQLSNFRRKLLILTRWGIIKGENRDSPP